MARRSWIIDWIVGALLIFAASLIVDSFISQFSDVNDSFKDVFISLAWLSPILLLSVTALTLILLCKDDKHLHRIGLLIILFSMLCRLAWVSVFDSYQVNDFGFYLNCGADAAATGRPADSRFCEDDYWKRSAFYTYPIALVFGKSLKAIKLVNVLLATLTTWIFFRLGTLLFGARLAAMGLLFFIWQPDLWYSMTLASPDIPGLFWLAVFFSACFGLQRRTLGLGVQRWGWSRLAGLSVALGAIIFFLDFTRTYHYGALLALSAYVLLESFTIFFAKPVRQADLARPVPGGASSLIRCRSVFTHALLWLFLPVGTYLLLNTSFWKIFKVPSEFGGSNLLCTVTDMDVLGTSTYEEVKDWALVQCPSVDTDEKTSYAIRKLMHDLSQVHEFFSYLRRKNRDLGLADAYAEWAAFRQPEPWDTTASQVKRVNSAHLPEQKGAIAIAHSIVLLFVLWRLCLYPRLPFRRQEWILLLFSGGLYAVILLLLESQPRYDIFLTFLFSWMAAQALDDACVRLFRTQGTSAPTIPAFRSRCYAGGVVLILFLLGAYWAASAAVRGTSLTLRDQSGFTQAQTEQLPAELRTNPLVPAVFVKNNYKEVLLGFAPGSIVEPESILAVQRTFSVNEKRSHHLRFFISSSAATDEPFDMNRNWTDTDLECIVAVNGKIIVRKRLKEFDDGNLYVSRTESDGLVFTPHMTLQFIIRSCGRIGLVSEDRAPVAALEYIDLQ